MTTEEARPKRRVSRTQALVLGFFGGVLACLVLIGAVAPGTFDRALQLPSADGRLRIAVVVALGTFMALLAIGVLRRWRWMFWLMMAAFLSGVLRVPAAILQVTGLLPADAPPWYLLLQAVIGLIQFGIGLAMLAGYRRTGVWA
jgi:hypothetical protein